LNEPAQGQQNGLKTAAKALDWPMVCLILATGGGNFLANQQNTTAVKEEQHRAYMQISDLHNALDDFEKRQRTLLENMDQSLKNQSQILKNQNEALQTLHKNS
jgi:shikimate kinase